MSTTNLKIERELAVINALKAAGFKASDYIEFPADTSNFLVANTKVYKGLPNNFTMEVLYINNKFITARVYNTQVDRNLTEASLIATKKQFNLN